MCSALLDLDRVRNNAEQQSRGDTVLVVVSGPVITATSWLSPGVVWQLARTANAGKAALVRFEIRQSDKNRLSGTSS